MPNSPHVNINLVGKPKVSFVENFLKWAVSAGKIIIIVTELIAVSALIYRFTLDRKIIDLHDQIKKSQLFVEAQGTKEKDYRSIQGRLASIKDIDQKTQQKIKIMNDILSVISTGAFSSTNLTVTEGNINIKGVAFSVFPISNFVDTLKKNPNVTSISLEDLASTSNGVEFKMTIELK